VSISRNAGDSASPSVNFLRSSSIASGVVVSRGSPAIAVLSESSVRSRRVTGSPSERA
jgi:hypothetical protein